MVGITDLVQVIVTCFSILSNIIYFGLSLSSIIGQFIVKFAVIVIETFFVVLKTAYSVLQILYEDYYVFMVDVINKGMCLLNFIGYLLECVTNLALNWWEATKNFCAAISEIGLFVTNNVCCISMKILHFIASIPGTLKHLIILIGSGTWLALTLLPLGTVYVFSLCVYCIGRTFDELRSFTQTMLLCLVQMFQDALHFFIDIPVEAQIGFALVLLLIYASMKYRTHIMLAFSYFGEKVEHLTVYIGTLLDRLLLRMFTNQYRDPLPREMDHEYEGSVAGSEIGTELDDSEQGNLTLTLRSRCVTRNKKNTKQNPLHASVHDQESMLCVVCQDREKCVIILPCRHLCLCMDCSTAIRTQHGLCPICRVDVRRTMKVYV